LVLLDHAQHNRIFRPHVCGTDVFGFCHLARSLLKVQTVLYYII
jgi:hypothetical protein